MTKNLKSREKTLATKEKMEEPMVFGNELQYPTVAFWKIDSNESYTQKTITHKEAKKVKTPHYHGHRQRLKERFLETQGGAIAEYELLELILYRSILRADAKPLAKNLLEHFGSLFDILSASIENLLKVKGCGPVIALDLKIIFKLFEHITLEKAKASKAIFNSWESCLTHCKLKLSNKSQELLYIMFLNKHHGLIRGEIQQKGTIDQAAIYPREIIKRALELGASGLILAHNHPSGNPDPSMADIEITLKIRQAGEPFGIVVHDHLIIGDNEFSSLKQSGFL